MTLNVLPLLWIEKKNLLMLSWFISQTNVNLTQQSINKVKSRTIIYKSFCMYKSIIKELTTKSCLFNKFINMNSFVVFFSLVVSIPTINLNQILLLSVNKYPSTGFNKNTFWRFVSDQTLPKFQLLTQLTKHSLKSQNKFDKYLLLILKR